MMLEYLFIIFLTAFVTSLGSAIATKLVKKDQDKKKISQNIYYYLLIRRYSDGRIELYEKRSEQQTIRNKDRTLITIEAIPHKIMFFDSSDYLKNEE